jgi:hypothetical protein
MTILRTLGEATAIDISWEGPFEFETVVAQKNTSREYVELTRYSDPI